MRRFPHWLWRSSRAFARSRRSAPGSIGTQGSLMGRERCRQLLPLVHEPGDPLLRAAALGRDGARARAVGIERGITERHAELPEPPLERVDLLLYLLEGRLRRSEEHTSELQSPCNLVCRLLLEKK